MLFGWEISVILSFENYIEHRMSVSRSQHKQVGPKSLSDIVN